MDRQIRCTKKASATPLDQQGTGLYALPTI